MVERLDATYAALAHPIRRRALELLADAPRRVTDLATPFDVSLAAVSKHVQVLERAHLVRRTVDGRDHVLHVAGEPLAAAEDWLSTYRSFWEGRLEALEERLRDG